MRFLKTSLLTALLALGISSTLKAEILDVNLLTDDGDGNCLDGSCTLRDAVLRSNTNQDTSNIINLTIPGHYVLTQPGSDNTGALGDLDLLSDLPLDQIKSVSIVGLGADNTIIDATPLQDAMDPDRVLEVPLLNAANGNNVVGLTLQDLGITGGAPAGFSAGGGVLVNTARLDSVPLTINNCDIFSNVAAAGGGVAIIKPENDPPLVNAVVINNSLFRLNGALQGGGLFLTSSSVEINNSTFSGNSAVGSALSTTSDQNIFVAINSSTITGNTGVALFSEQAEGENTTEITIANSLLLGDDGLQSPDECQNSAGVNFNSHGFNLLGDLTGCNLVTIASDHDSVDPTLVFDPAGLADNGGPTQTIALLLAGPAVDTANPEGCFDGDGLPNNPDNTPLTTDQRLEFPRISGAACDVGAYELKQEADLSILKIANADAVEVGDNLSYTVTVTNNGPAVANNVVVTDQLPLQSQFVSVNPGDPTCSFNAQTQEVKCTIDKLLDGESAEINIVVTVTAEGNGNISNTATVVPGNETDPDPDDNSSSVTTEIPGDGGTGGFLEGSGCSLNSLPVASGASSWLWMVGSLSLFWLGLRKQR